MTITNGSRTSRSRAILVAAATLSLLPLAQARGDDPKVAPADYVAVAVDLADAIEQTSGQAPVASKDAAKLGRAKKSDAPKTGVVDEVEQKLPKLNVRADSDEPTEHKPHGASLAGVQPGVTKFVELSKNPTFAKPVADELVDGYRVLTYQDPTLPDATIQIVGKGELVEAIMINLAEARAESDARKVFESEIKDVRPIWTPDELGNFREVFPEKGVAFVLEKGENPGLPSNRVVQIVAETVKCEYFIMRAEQDLRVSYTYARDDAEHALLHDAEAPGAYWILAKTHLAVGDATSARKRVYKAIKLNDSLPQFHLTYIEALIEAGEVDSALRYMDAVRESFQEHPLYQTEALVLDSILRREEAEPDYDASIAQGQRALKLLGTLYESKLTPEVVWAAKALEERANLSIAIAVARKKWKNAGDQERAFEWIDAATAVATEIDKMASKESQLPSAQIDVLQAGLECCLEMPDAKQVDAYADRAIASADIYLKKTLDEVSAASVRWRIGKALANAARIYESRGDFAKAAKLGEQAVEYLTVVTDYRPPVDRVPTALARLELGQIYADGLKDAKKASAHFGKAVELFEEIKSVVRAKDAAAIGGSLASAAASSWKRGEKQEGLKALVSAVEFLEKAREGGFVSDADMWKPYANLSVMYKGSNDAANAAKYKKLADQVAPKK
ncbi:MAG: hypothetical protein IJM30_02695 [Thermoguttaceae bacterium]|nr:hypothetical protein [Thermoguttaceae bacterium]